MADTMNDNNIAPNSPPATADSLGITFSQGAQATPQGIANAAATGMYSATPTTTVPVDQTTGQTPLNIASTIPPVTDTASPVVAGAKVAGQDITTAVTAATQPVTKEQQQAAALNSQLSDLYGQDTGKAAALSTEEANQNVPGMTKQLTDINNEINIKNAEYDQQVADAEKNSAGQTTAYVTGYQAAVRKAQASDIGLLVARAQAVQGNLTLAKDTASKAVDLKYSAVEDQIKTKQAQLDLLKPTLSKQDAAQADFLTQQNKQALDQIAEEKQKVKDNYNVIMQNNVKTPFANQNGTFMDKNGNPFATPADFFKAAGVKSFAEAYQKGLVTDVQGLPDPKNTQVVEANGRKLLIDQRTGATIKDLGASSSGSAPSFGDTQKLQFQADSAQTAKNLASKVGTDGFVSPQIWRKALNDWTGVGYSGADFVSNYKQYANPNDPQDYGLGVK